ncbi:DMT family transporter [Candidatus Lariskella endosymbiont of Hedychridium roseum]|uniref:DMT family transporter n=1 Tax=Candidatus Lariskella endosymbiont of Hedychridium roseum TaxID=3077949 RepID=UPI0030D463A7
MPKLSIDNMFQMSHVNRGFVLMIASCILYAFLNSLIKYMGYSVDPLFLVFCRSFFAVLILLPFVLANHRVDMKFLIGKSVILPNLVRVGLGFVGNCFWFIAMQHMNITECVAISFTTPLFIMLFSIIFLAEKADIKQWALLLIGFLAAIYIKTPDIKMMNYYSFLVLIAAALWASCAIIFKKFVISHVHPVSIVFFTSAATCFLSAPIAVAYFAKLDLFQVLCVISMSICMIFAKLCAAFAYKFSQLSTIIPLDFSRLIFNSILAYIIFGEVLSQRTFVGAAIIVVSSSYLLYLHNKPMKKGKEG